MTVPLYGRGSVLTFFSGGMDSYIHMIWARREFGTSVAMYVDFKHRYAQREIYAASEICGENGWTLIHRELDLRSVEDAKSQIPLRNIYLLMFGTYYADNLVFGMLHNEQALDKRPGFVFDMQDLLNGQYPGRRIRIHTPFARFTKTEMLAWYFDAVGRTKASELAILKTIGCYDPSGSCGVCNSCFNRWVALTNNGVKGAHYRIMLPHIWVLQQLCRRDVGALKPGALSLLSRMWYKRRYMAEVYRAFRLSGYEHPFSAALLAWRQSKVRVG